MGAIDEVESETKTAGKREDTDPREETDSDEEELGRSPEPQIDLNKISVSK